MKKIIINSDTHFVFFPATLFGEEPDVVLYVDPKTGKGIEARFQKYSAAGELGYAAIAYAPEINTIFIRGDYSTARPSEGSVK